MHSSQCAHSMRVSRPHLSALSSSRSMPSSVMRRRDRSLLPRISPPRPPCSLFSTKTFHPLPPVTEVPTPHDSPPKYPIEHFEIENRLLKARDWNEALRAVTELKNARGILRLRAHQHAVELACQAGAVDQVKALMQEAKNRGNVPTYQAYIAAIGLYRDKEQIEAAMEALEDFQRNTPQFRKGYDARLVSSVISACGPRDVFRAIKMFHDMLRAGVEPDAQAYASIIYACVRGNRVRKAEEFLREMLARKLRVDSRVYTAVISRMPLDPAIHETPSRILSLLAEIRRHRHKPDALLYSSMIRALSVHATHISAALSLLKEMQEQDLTLPIQLCNSVLSNLLIHRPTEALQLFDQMKGGLAIPNEQTYSILVVHFAKSKDLDRSLSYVAEAENAGIHLLPHAFATLLETAVRLNNTKAQQELKQRMKVAGFDPSKLPPRFRFMFIQD